MKNAEKENEKKNYLMEEEWKEKENGSKESEGGRKTPYVSKNEAKYKVKEIKLWWEIATVLV